MKFILYCKIKCCYIIIQGSIKKCKYKNKYIYLILDGYVKQYNNVKNVNFTGGGEISYCF